MTIPESVFSHVGDMQAALEYLPHSPAFFERSELVKALEDERSTRRPTWRSLAAPVLATDLGVRKFDDLATFYLAHCEIAKREPIKNSVIEKWLLENGDRFYDFADAAITFFGAYGAVSSASSLLLSQLYACGDFNGLILAGTVLAANNKDKSRLAFEYAVDCASSATDRYLASHRLAATEIKRFNDPNRGRDLLRKALLQVKTSSSSAPLEEALSRNLEALAYLQKRESDHALEALVNASMVVQGALEDENLDARERSVATRYASQIAINLAQMYLADERPGAAVGVLEENRRVVAAKAPEYLGEAISELACALHYAERYNESIVVATEAFGYLYHIGAIRAIAALREIVVASYFRLGLYERAETVADLIETDPLGFKSFGGWCEQ